MIVVSFTILFMVIFLSNDKLNAAPGNNFILRLTDSPAAFTSLYVEITGVDVQHADGKWIQLSNDIHYVNILSLTNGTEIELANKLQLRDGNYIQLRLHFGTDHSITLFNPATNHQNPQETITRKLKWLGNYMIDIPINEEINKHKSANVLLDFDVAQSVIQNGDSFTLKPVLRVVEDEKTGLKGQVTGTENALITLQSATNTFHSYTDPGGHFLFRGIPAGSYQLLVLVNPHTFSSPHNTLTIPVEVLNDEIKEIPVIHYSQAL